jgi:hypothetical protein
MLSKLLPPHAAKPPHGPIAEQVAREVAARLPTTLVKMWVENGRGVLLVVEHEQPRFESSSFYWRDIQAQGALFIPPDYNTQALWETVGAWLDAFGGSFGHSERMSQGHGATPTLTAAAARLRETLALGYSQELLGTADARVLFARTVAAHQTNPQALSAADPTLARWLRATLFDKGFWRKVNAECGMRNAEYP